MAIKITDDTNYSNIANAIRNKLKVSTTFKPGEMAAAIENIKSGEPDWRELGYEEAPASVMDGFDYAKDIHDDWDSSVTNRSNQYKDDKEIKYFPEVNISNIANAINMFNGSTLTSLVESGEWTSLATAESMIRNCLSLSNVDLTLGVKDNNYFEYTIEADSEVTEVLYSDILGYTYSGSDIFTVTRNGELLTIDNPSKYSRSSTKITLASSYYLQNGDVLVIKIYKSLVNMANLCTNDTSLKSVKIDFGNRVGSLAEAFASTGYPLEMPELLNSQSATSVRHLFNANYNFRPTNVNMSFPIATESQNMFSSVGNYDNSSSAYKSITWGPVNLDLPVSTNCGSIFYACTNLIGHVTLNAPNAKTFTSAFYGCGITGATVDLSSATHISSMFSGCSSLVNANDDIEITYNVTPVSTPSIYECSEVFKDCINLRNLPIIQRLDGSYTAASFAVNCKKITTTPTGEFNAWRYDNMFKGCTLLETVNYEINPDNVKMNDNRLWFTSMFESCPALLTCPTIGKIGSDVSGARTITDLNFSNMFNGCTSLQDVPVFTFGASLNTNPNTSNMFINCNSITDQSLENILQTCINIANTGTGRTRTLRSMGLSSTYYPDYKFDPTDARSLDPDLLNAFFATGCRVS